jgi:hypothetical protein
MEKDWIQVFNTGDTPFAWIVKNALESEDIQAVLIDKTSSPYLNFVPGDIEIYVHQDQAEKALDIIYRMHEDN